MTTSANPDTVYSREELAAVMRAGYDTLIDFVSTPEFQALMTEFGALSPVERPRFVVDVVLDDEALAARGIVVPHGVLIQRSSFGDRRPTLFCVKTFLPDGYRDIWENVNLTFDNAFAGDSISREPEIAWRAPLPVDLAARVLAEGGDLEQV